MATILERRSERPTRLSLPEVRDDQRSWRAARRIGGAALALQGTRWLVDRLNQRSVPPSRAGGALGDVAGELGRGLVAGLVGTLVITLAAAADQEIRRRRKAARGEAAPRGDLFSVFIGPWLFSADAVGKVLGGVTPKDEAARRRLALAAHLGYGSTWGMSLGVLRVAGIQGPAAMGVLLGGVLGAEMGVMPRVGFFPPVGQWGREAVISSSYQHALYAIAAGLTFDRLHR